MGAGAGAGAGCVDEEDLPCMKGLCVLLSFTRISA